MITLKHYFKVIQVMYILGIGIALPIHYMITSKLYSKAMHVMYGLEVRLLCLFICVLVFTTQRP